MVEGYIHGKMGENIKVNTFMIKSMVMVYILGLIIEDIKVIGKMVNSMEKVIINN